MKLKKKITKIKIHIYKLTFHFFQKKSKKNDFFQFHVVFEPTSLKAQASANFSLSLEPSKYPGRCWISFSSVLLSVVMMFPISLQTQASANVTISLRTKQVPGKITDWLQAQLRLCLYLFSAMVIFPIPLQAQASAIVK